MEADSLQPLLKPLHGHQESTLLRIPMLLILQISAHRKSMLNTTVQIDLIRRLHLLQHLLREVSLLLGEDHVRLRRGNGQRALHVAQLGLLHETRVRAVPGVDLLAVWQQVADDVLGAEAVSHCADLLAVVHSAHLDERRVDDGVDIRRQVGRFLRVVSALQPLLDVKVAWSVQWDRVATEHVRHYDEVAVGGELVGDQLGVDEFVPDHVGDEEDAEIG